MMDKPKTRISKQIPVNLKIQTRAQSQREKFYDNLNSSSDKIFFDEPQLYEKKNMINQNRQIENPQDIDMYFATCFNYNKGFKCLTEKQMFQRELLEDNREEKQMKKVEKIINKQDLRDQELKEQDFAAQLINSRQMIVSDKHNLDQESPNSPIFGHKLLKNIRTPPIKFEEFKVFDQSQSSIKKDFIDYFDEAPKNQSSSLDPQKINFTCQFTNSNFQTKKRITKTKKISNKKKQKIDEQASLDEQQFSFKKSNSYHDVKRRSQILKLSVLALNHSKFDQFEKLLTCLDNSAKTLMNYYNLRELNTNLLSFRTNVCKIIRQQIEKMLSLTKEKKYICMQTMNEKFKVGNNQFNFTQQKCILSNVCSLENDKLMIL